MIELLHVFLNQGVTNLSGLTDLKQLLQQMEPELGEDEYVFATFPGARYGDLAALAPLASIQEKEGLGLVIERTVAERAQIHAGTVCRRISLNVHSSLEAVGLTAVVAGELAKYGISANVIAGYYHDHVYVPAHHADKAIRLLNELSCPD
jgi:hypothetical protein